MNSPFSLPLTNPHRLKPIEEFADKDHAVMTQYYDLLDSNLSNNQLKREMEKLIGKDPDFYDPYLVLKDILISEGSLKKARLLLFNAYEKAAKRIVDKNGSFPKLMEWGWLENRHIIRTIESFARELWALGGVEDALEIFRKILRFNPHDNTGARHDILAIRLRLKSDYKDRFAVKDRPGFLDAIKMTDWFDFRSHKSCCQKSRFYYWLSFSSSTRRGAEGWC